MFRLAILLLRIWVMPSSRVSVTAFFAPLIVCQLIMGVGTPSTLAGTTRFSSVPLYAVIMYLSALAVKVPSSASAGMQLSSIMAASSRLRNFFMVSSFHQEEICHYTCRRGKAFTLSRAAIDPVVYLHTSHRSATCSMSVRVTISAAISGLLGYSAISTLVRTASH